MWEPTEEFLMHHGIDGQKWGVRNGPPYPLEKGQKKKYRTDKGYKKRPDSSYSHTDRSVNDMSNVELQKRIDRKELEKRYADLDDQQVSRGRQKVMSYVRDYATVAAAVLTTAKLVDLGMKHIKR